MLDLASDCDVVNKSGAWYAYQGEKIGQGRENAKQYLKEHPQIRDEIERQVRAHYELTDDGESDGGAAQDMEGKRAGKADVLKDDKKRKEEPAAEKKA